MGGGIVKRDVSFPYELWQKCLTIRIEDTKCLQEYNRVHSLDFLMGGGTVCGGHVGEEDMYGIEELVLWEMYLIWVRNVGRWCEWLLERKGG